MCTCVCECYNQKCGLFQPLKYSGNSFLLYYISGNLVDWGNHSESTETVNLPIIDYFPKPYPAQLPMSIPRDLADRLLAFHGAPFAWFVGQFYKFLMRPSAHLEAYMREKEEKLGMSRPIVGYESVFVSNVTNNGI